MGVADQNHDQCAIAQSEIAHDAQNRLLLRTHDMGGADEFCGTAKLRASTGGRDFRHRLAASHERTCKSAQAGTRFDGYRFTRQHRLVEQNFPVGECYVRGNHAAERQLHHISGHKFDRRYNFPRAITADRHAKREPRPERRQGRLGTALLERAEGCIEH